ncbi:5'-methylthioadenosine nucleosidase [Acidisarcina polymorpha]|uniref:5'-methylthioadenosine nucleosidase n=1 Tax=Acidisarcina polymorpha TaxID=2211140 RepID=A0A2Z5FW58_9BACT|nr:5'-methylthioadenosine nucleosidase [Acidisarcina polymorpha]
MQPLVRNWKRETTAAGVVVYSSEKAIAAFAGMGAARAHLATEAALSFGPVHQLTSAGWAGGLHSGLTAGTVCPVHAVIDASSGQLYEINEPNGAVTTDLAGKGMLLVTVDRVVSAEQKHRLRERFAADLVDMEAASVARAARAHQIPFASIKAISDEYNFDLPGMERFISPQGQFQEGSFAAYVALRPGLWKLVGRMARASSRASLNLCNELERFLAADENPGKA